MSAMTSVQIALTDVGYESHRTVDVYSFEPVMVRAFDKDAAGNRVERDVSVCAVMIQRDDYRNGAPAHVEVSVYPDTAMDPWMLVSDEVGAALIAAVPAQVPDRPIV